MIINLPYRDRQTGKTTELANRAALVAMNKPNAKVIFLGEDYKTTYRNVGPLIEHFLKQHNFDHKHNMFKSYFELYNGSKIEIGNIWSTDPFIGHAYDYIFIDLNNLEVIDKEARKDFTQFLNDVIYPTTITTNGEITLFEFKPLNGDKIRERLGVK